jgi:excisionase family DNA binding protein
VPPSIAGEVVRILAAHLDARVRADGGELSPGARRLLVELQAAADRTPSAPAGARPGAATGRRRRRRGTVEVTVNEAARLMECSPRWVRALIAAGRLPARRAGARLWLLDAAALDHYRQGDADHDQYHRSP